MRSTLSEARAKAGMTQGDIAEKLGVSTMAVSYWERGLRNINAKDLDRFLEVIGADRADVIMPYETLGGSYESEGS